MAIEQVIILALVASSLICMASAIPGTATFYTVYVPSSCYGYEDQGALIAAANPALFNNRTACGRSYKIRCTRPTNQSVPQPCRNGEITVRVVDLCLSCQADQFDLSQEAFSMIALSNTSNPIAGRIQIEYNPA